MSTHRSKINIGHTEIEKRSDDIVQINASNRTYTVKDIKEIHEAVLEINNNQKALLLLIANNFTSFDIASRHFLSTPEASVHSIANAYVIKSLAQRLVLNFMIRVKATAVPTKFFLEESAAVNWLITFQNELAFQDNNK